MNTTSTGQAAEQAVVQKLSDQGYKFLAKNWRNRFCEIDIVVVKNNIIYFVEVKYRSSTTQGGGLDYITPKKLTQMRYAAEFWIQENKWSGDYLLCAVAVSGNKEKFVIDQVQEIF